MERAQFGGLLIAAAAALAAPPALAHHSTERFDRAQEITIDGVIARYDWVNPHVYIYVEQTTDDGQTVEWEIEGGPPALLRRMGWSREMLNAGDALSVTGNPTKDETFRTLYLTSMRLSDGTELDERGGFAQLLTPGPAPARGADGINGLWTTVFSLEEFASFEAANIELTEAGRAAREVWDEATMNPGLDCIPPSAPNLMYIPDAKHVTTTENGSITIEADFDGALRTIYMDEADHAGASPSLHGHSIGRWEGATLVVDTTHFAPHAMGNGWGVPSGAQKHLVEWLTPNLEGTSLAYHYVLTDPEYLAAPVTGDAVWTYAPDASFGPERCDLAAARRFADD